MYLESNVFTSTKKKMACMSSLFLHQAFYQSSPLSSFLPNLTVINLMQDIARLSCKSINFCLHQDGTSLINYAKQNYSCESCHPYILQQGSPTYSSIFAMTIIVNQTSKHTSLVSF